MASLRTLLRCLSVAALVSAHPHHNHEKRGTVPIDGSIITKCTVKGVVALTFDDGPFAYTQSIVDQLTAAGHKATFFQNGQFCSELRTRRD